MPPQSPDVRAEWPAMVGPAIVFAYVLALGLLFFRGLWILGPDHRPLVTDFLEVWVAGRSVWEGHAAVSYDWHLHHAAQAAFIGHPFKGYLGWLYPPPFLFVAAILAATPYVAAYVAWVIMTAAGYAFAIARVAGRWETGPLALALPCSLGCALVGQNGFLTAAILILVLLNMEDRKWLAGLGLALLTYKPQFGLVFPVVLLAARDWRTLLWASLGTAAIIGLSLSAFGEAPFLAFWHFLPFSAQTVLSDGHAGFAKLQSVYGFVRWLGGGETWAWSIHIGAALLTIIFVLHLWRRDVPYALKAAALASAAMIATPYLYMYDFPVLAVPFALLWRARPFDPAERLTAAAATAAMMVFAWVAAPVGPLLAVLPIVLIVRRVASWRGGDVALQPA